MDEGGDEMMEGEGEGEGEEQLRRGEGESGGGGWRCERRWEHGSGREGQRR